MINKRLTEPQQILLTAADVRQWQTELVAAEATVADLKRKLDAASVFFPAAGAQPPTIQADTPVNGWVLTVLRDSQKALTPRQIRAEILRAGGSIGSENYLYTAIQRVLRRGQIVKSGDGYVIAAQESPEGDTGSQPAPSPMAEFTQSGGAGETVPEAGGT